MSELLPARVRVPCSTSNFGSGYDTVGLALDRYLEASFEPGDMDGVRLERSGTLSRLDDSDGPDLVQEAFEKRARHWDATPSGTLTLHSEVPVARGLGTSAGALLAGFDLADAACGRPRDDDAAFDAAYSREGHGDNIAPCLFGGLRAVARTADGPVVMELSLSDRVGFAYAAPAARVSTAEARDILPRQVPHAVAAASLGRLVALIRGLAEGDPELIRIGVKDELHLPYRMPLIPGVTGAISAGMDAGAWAVTVSGAGSGLIALCDPADADGVAAAMHEVFDAGAADPECVGFSLRPDFDGLRRLIPR